MFCPFCGSKNTQRTVDTFLRGDIYVAEDTGTSTEFYAEVDEWKCIECASVFFPMIEEDVVEGEEWPAPTPEPSWSGYVQNHPEDDHEEFVSDIQEEPLDDHGE